MTKGGYQIIDLEGRELESGVGMVYDDIYKKIEGTRKAILISGLNVGGTEYHDTFVELTANGSNYEGTIYGKSITISDINVVTVTNATVTEPDEPSTEPDEPDEPTTNPEE